MRRPAPALDELPPDEAGEFEAYLMVVPTRGGEPPRVARLQGPQMLFQGNEYAWHARLTCPRVCGNDANARPHGQANR